ncbi:hypothetical protein BpHYR1_022145 [Brachionus plicatilis]|uniref:Uncharacterized protein n=1 Tax=Brachionus plicatilis TaxID=10195 RepID=A0A3M7P8B6_BRAPC|nr:hypothetical protein BpHYR1_022145 [Brachionus plicatilis]
MNSPALIEKNKIKNFHYLVLLKFIKPPIMRKLFYTIEEILIEKIFQRKPCIKKSDHSTSNDKFVIIFFS